jgi:hypothetical protein
MRPDVIRRMLRQRPFEPFRVFVLDGTSYDVRHPELVLLERATLSIPAAAANHPVPMVEREVLVALFAVSRLEPLDPQ